MSAGRKMKRATVEVTREVFRRMPLLLTRAAFLEVTGLDKRGLEALVESGQVTAWRAGNVGNCKSQISDFKLQSPKLRGGSYAKYLKVEAARIAGVEHWLQ